MATRFWVGGTGTWDASDTTHWASSSNGAGGQTVPGSSDSATFDGSSGGGTVTVNTTVGVTTLTMSAFTGHLDFSANNNNVNLSSGFSNNGSATRTLSMGNGTWTVTSAASANPWLQGGATGLTLNCNSSTLVFALTHSTLSSVTLGTSLTYNVITCSANSNLGVTAISCGTAVTIGTLNLVGPNVISFSPSVTYTIATLSMTGGTALTSLLEILGSTPGTATTLTLANAATPQWCTFRDITKAGAGSINATNSIDLGHNTSFAGIAAPSTGAGGTVGVIGG